MPDPVPPPVGVQQPNEVVLYRYGDANPYFVRFTYSFENLGSSTNPLDAGQIVAVARTAGGTPLPQAGATATGFPFLPQTKVVVRRYSDRTGEARIVVEWGVRSSRSGGAAPTIESRQSSVAGASYPQPYMVISTLQDEAGSPVVSLPTVRTRSISRIRIRVQYSKLVTTSGNTLNSINSRIAANLGKLFQYNGADRILVGGSYSPFSATQGYVNTVFDTLSPVPAVAEGGILSNGVDGISKPVDALLQNQVYKQPTGSGTEAEAFEDTYGEFGELSELWWLLG